MKLTTQPVQDIPAPEFKAINDNPWMRSRVIFGTAVGDCPKSTVRLAPIPTRD